MQKPTPEQLRELLPQIELVSPFSVHPHPDNPRTITERKFNQLVKSVTEFWQMLLLRPIVVNEDSQALGGNMRILAARKAGLEVVPIIRAIHLTQTQQREFTIKDNIPFGDWDFDALANNWDSGQLNDWGFSIPVFQEQKQLAPLEDIGDHANPRSQNQNARPQIASFNVLVRCDTEEQREAIKGILNAGGLSFGEQYYFV
jgi:hypothetical protein